MNEAALIHDLAVGVLTCIFALLILLVCIGVAWYIIWIVILSKFKLVREIVDGLATAYQGKKEQRDRYKIEQESNQQQNISRDNSSPQPTKKKIRKVD